MNVRAKTCAKVRVRRREQEREHIIWEPKQKQRIKKSYFTVADMHVRTKHLHLYAYAQRKIGWECQWRMAVSEWERATHCPK